MNKHKIEHTFRNRMRTGERRKTLDEKLADFFEEDPKLGKYANKQAPADNEELKEFAAGLYASVKRTAASVVSRLRKPSVTHRQAILVVLVFGVASTFFTVNRFGSANTDTPQTDTQGVSIVTETVEAPTPEFSVVQPVDESSTEATPAYDINKKVASLPDKIGDTNIIISQQQLRPEDLSKDNFLLGVAQSFGINREVQTTKGPLFIGSNQQQQVVTAVFRLDSFLIFIRTNGIVDDAQVIDYVDKIQI